MPAPRGWPSGRGSFLDGERSLHRRLHARAQGGYLRRANRHAAAHSPQIHVGLLAGDDPDEGHAAWECLPGSRPDLAEQALSTGIEGGGAHLDAGARKMRPGVPEYFNDVGHGSSQEKRLVRGATEGPRSKRAVPTITPSGSGGSASCRGSATVRLPLEPLHNPREMLRDGFADDVVVRRAKPLAEV